jgi:hypothetical protein
MRVAMLLTVAAAAALLAPAPQPASAGGRNPDGLGIYTPEPRGPDGKRVWRYDPRSWYYSRRGYYPYYNSGYWVPREAMRYRYRYTYYGPQYRYYRAWGYGLPEPGCCGRRWSWW